jgi:hypothetical protein
VRQCPFCNEALSELQYLGDEHHGDDNYVSDFRGVTCTICGWWVIKLYRHIDGNYIKPRRDSRPDFVHSWHWTHATLKELDPSDITTPIDELRDYLIAKFESRFDVNPRLMEETVGSIFRNMDWNVVVMCYSKDGGIDAIITKDGATAGVQVKRYRDTVGVSQLREFTGALVSKKLTKGVFATTSRFTKTAVGYAEELLPEIRIELMDAPRLFDALHIGRKERLDTIEEVFAGSRLASIFKSNVLNKRILKKHFFSEKSVAVESFRGRPPSYKDTV